MIRQIVRFENGQSRSESDAIAVEEPLEIRVRGRAISVTMRTPADDVDLAAGFLFTEGIIRCASDIRSIEPCERNEFGNRINVLLEPAVAVDFARLTRHVFASSSCGLCGKATIDAIRERFPPIATHDRPAIPASRLARFPGIMRQSQCNFDRTGGLHAAALFRADGELLAVREDVGRHNAVDKVLGHALLNGLMPLYDHVLLVSGRTSFEIMQKALAGGLPIVAAVSAPSSLAVEFATENNQTLVGFLRGDRMNIYAGDRRIGRDAEPMPG